MNQHFDVLQRIQHSLARSPTVNELVLYPVIAMNAYYRFVCGSFFGGRRRRRHIYHSLVFIQFYYYREPRTYVFPIVVFIFERCANSHIIRLFRWFNNAEYIVELFGREGVGGRAAGRPRHERVIANNNYY